MEDNKLDKMEILDKIKYNSEGLVPAVIQDVRSGVVLMLAYMDKEAVRLTLETGNTWFWSRSRKKYWQKGESSGHIQEVKEVYFDCDADTLLIKVEQQGVACHTGQYSCFFNTLFDSAFNTSMENYTTKYKSSTDFISYLSKVVRQRKVDLPQGSYIAQLLQKGDETIARKVGEEALETVIAYMGDSDQRLIEEAADLLFHVMIALEARGIPFEQVVKELQGRHEE